jgi:hypothetical protein
MKRWSSPSASSGRRRENIPPAPSPAPAFSKRAQREMFGAFFAVLAKEWSSVAPMCSQIKKIRRANGSPDTNDDAPCRNVGEDTGYWIDAELDAGALGVNEYEKEGLISSRAQFIYTWARC